MAAETGSVEEHLQNFINQIADEQKFENFQTKITPVSSGGANYTSNLFNIKISQSEGRDDLNLFAKVAALNEKARGHVLFELYDNEYYFYKFLANTYKQLEEKQGVSDRIKFPAFYGAVSTSGREILVLEDLSIRGFGSANRFESVNWPYAAAAVKELAKFHALSIAFKHDNPHEFDKFCAPFPGGFFAKSETTDVLFNRSITRAQATVRKENKDKLDAFMKDYVDIKYYNDLFKPLNCKVIIHAAFRPANMMHKVLSDDTTEVIPIDFQTIQPSSPVVDLYYFIFTATDGAFRAKYFQKLIDHYYAELGVAFKELGLKINNEYPRKDFENDLKVKLPFGLLVSVLVLPALLTSEGQGPAVGDDFVSFTFSPGELYASRLNDAVDDYIAWGIL